MRITDIEVIGLRVPGWDAGSFDGFYDNCVVQVHTDAGITGLAEVDSVPAVIRAIVETPTSHIHARGLKEVLLGRNAADVETLWDSMYDATSYYGRRGVVIHAISAIDIALWDIRGKAAGKPRCRDAPRKAARAGQGLWHDLSAWRHLRRGSQEHRPRTRARSEGDKDLRRAVLARRFRRSRDVDPRRSGSCRRRCRSHDRRRGGLGCPRARPAADAGLPRLRLPLGRGSAAARRSGWARRIPGFWRADRRRRSRRDDPLRLRGAVRSRKNRHRATGRDHGGRPDRAQTDRFARKGPGPARGAPHGYKSNITIACNLAFLGQLWREEMLEYSTSRSPLRWELTHERLEIGADGKVAVPSTPGLGVSLNWDAVRRYRQ